MKILFYTLGTIGLTISGLIFFQGFLVPLSIGLFVATLLIHFQRRYSLSKKFVLGVYSVILIGIALGLWWGGSEIWEGLQVVFESTEASLDSILSIIQQRTGLPVRSGSDRIISGFQSLAGSMSFTSLGSSIGGFFVDLILIIVYSYLFVIYEQIIIRTLDHLHGNAYKRWSIAIKKNAHYLGSLLQIIAVLAVLYSLVLLILGVPYAINIAIIAAICALVPTVGTAVGIVGASIATYALTQSVTNALLILGLLGSIQLIEEYLILPAIAGKQLNINPLATIVLVVLGGVVWGVAGIFLVLPIVSIIQSIIERKNSHHRFVILTSKND